MIRFTLIAVLATIVVFQITGEKVPVNEGAMGDGVFFREVAGNFLEDVETGGYNVFQMQRVMPFAFVNVLFGALEILKSNDNLMRGMLVLHFLFLGFGVYWYFSLATKLRLGDGLTILGFVLVFANFAVLKDPWYNPFSTDLATLVLGIAQANYFIKFNRQKLFLVSIIAGFVWPTMMLTGLLLIFLPVDPMVVYPKEAPKSLFPVLASLVLLVFLAFISLMSGRIGADMWDTLLHLGSIFTLVFFVFAIMVRNPVDWSQSYSLFLKKNKPQKMLRFGGILFTYLLVVFLLSGSNGSLDMAALVQSLVLDTLRFPGDFLFGHMMFYGFLIPLSLAFFPRMIKESAKLGMGMMAVSVMMLVFFVHPESRLLLAFLPFMVVLLLKSVRRYKVVNKDVVIISLANLLISAFWLPLNVAGMEEALGLGHQEMYDFPAQRYWMHFGNMMSFEVYLAAGLVFVGLLILAYRGKVRYKREEYVRGRSLAAKI